MVCPLLNITSIHSPERNNNQWLLRRQKTKPNQIHWLWSNINLLHNICYFVVFVNNVINCFISESTWLRFAIHLLIIIFGFYIFGPRDPHAVIIQDLVSLLTLPFLTMSRSSQVKSHQFVAWSVRTVAFFYFCSLVSVFVWFFSFYVLII